MANSSNPPDGSPIIQNHAYLDASNTNVSNFVSVRLSGNHNYDLWKKQMVCLMKAHDMCLFDDKDPTCIKIKDKYDSVLQGWIIGSLSEDALRLVLDLHSAQDVWDKLKKCYDSTMSSKQDSSPIKLHTTTEREDKYVALGESTSKDKCIKLNEPDAKGEEISHIETKEGHADSPSTKDIETGMEDMKVALGESATNDKDKKVPDVDEHEAWIIANALSVQQFVYPSGAPTKVDNNENADDLPQLIKDGNWNKVYEHLENKNMLKQKINKNDDNTLLHIAVGIGLSSICNKIIKKLDKDELSELKNSEGNTALHIAAIVGNKDAAKLLVEKNNSLLGSINKEEKTPLDCACEYMHLDTIKTLLDAIEKLEKDKNAIDVDGRIRSTLSKQGVSIVANAFSARRYKFAYDLIDKNRKYAVLNKDLSHLMMAMAKTFPAEERHIFPSLESISNHLIVAVGLLLFTSVGFCTWKINIMVKIFLVPLFMVYWVIHLLYVFLVMILFLLWKAAAKLVPSKFKHKMKWRRKDLEEAKRVLELVCKENPDNMPDLYTRPILEAARQDAFEVVQEILWKWPEAIKCKDNNGYDIIQLATMHRSHRVYNLVYTIGERKSIYRTMEDDFGNNILHLAGRLAPPNKLKRGTGAALQLQRELQWRQEVEKLVFPAYITKENIYEETPELVFTKEHKDLVVEGEQWMKTVAESCSVTAALIITIVFAAAITVPGGNQDSGVPIFREDVAFLIFLITDAISLFSSTTALLVFLSILTARFAEEDFLVSLPRRLIFGLLALLISTAAMMIAFGTTLFLVSSAHNKKWLLALICVSSFIPIGVFFFLQFPLILDLWRSTFRFKFGKSEIKSGRSNHKLLLFIGK